MPYNNTPIAPSNEISGQVSVPLARVQKIINADPERLHISKNASFAIAMATEMFIQHLATTTHNVVKAERKPRRNIQYRDIASAVAKTDNLEFLVDVVPKTMPYKEFKAKQAEKEKLKAREEEEMRKAEGEDATARADAGAEAGGSGSAPAAPVGGVKQKDAEQPTPSAAGASAVVTAVPVNGNGVGQQTANGAQSTSQSLSAEVMGQKEETGTPDVMDVDSVERVEESEPEEDGAAMQIEMEMRPRPDGTSPVAPRTNGFTAINAPK